MEAHGHVIDIDHRMLPEAQLWTEVVIQAIHDLASKDLRDRSSAREWFAADSEEVGGFIWVCHVMNVDPGGVRSALAKGNVLERSESLFSASPLIVRDTHANTPGKRRHTRKGHGRAGARSLRPVT